MFGEIVSWLLSSSKRSILRHTASFYNVPMVVQQIAVFARLEYLARPRILFTNIDGRLQFPKVLKYRLIEFIVDDG